MQSYKDLASQILKQRQDQREKQEKDIIVKVREDFITYTLKGNFKNLIDLILEFYELNFNLEDQEFVLQELFKATNPKIYIVKKSEKQNRVVEFENIFGLNILFISYQNEPSIFYSEIYKEGKNLKGRDRITLAGYVADYLESKEK